MYLAENIRFLRKQKNLSQDELAQKLGYKSYTTVQKWESGVSEPPFKSLSKMSELFGIDMDTLAHERLATDADRFWEFAQAYNRKHFPDVQEISTTTLPVLGEIACGEPKFMNEEYEVYTSAQTGVKADFILIAKGDSMIGARIHDGDLVFIRKQPEVENGQIAAVAIGDEATLKRFYRYDDDLVVLRAENPNYEDQIYRGSDLTNVKVLGLAVAFQSDVR